MSDVLARVRELLVNGGNDTAGPAARAAIADEIDQLTESVKQEADVQYGGRSSSPAPRPTRRPTRSAAPTPTRATQARSRARSDPGSRSRSTPTSAALLGDGQAARDDKLLHTLRDIADHLRGGTTADANALRGTDMQRLDANLDTLNGIRADVGARTNRLAIADSRLSGLSLNATQLLSNTEDADMAQTITEYTTQQAAYNAALRAGANIVQTSLLDFLH